ncbi:hypothetical protein [Methylobacterium indicum]|uniref:hypothetical protein n=1 Tax=Methylobacterium indicum TaxID=1775910 RepID=UPI0024356A29|nr:hypothetical protein [Methylobacterium indicum]
MTGENSMSRNAILSQYRPIRRAIQTVLAQALDACKKPDLDRAAKHLGLADDALLEDDTVFEMLRDIAQFEANQRGRRAFDGFLHGRFHPGTGRAQSRPRPAEALWSISGV